MFLTSVVSGFTAFRLKAEGWVRDSYRGLNNGIGIWGATYHEKRTYDMQQDTTY